MYFFLKKIVKKIKKNDKKKFLFRPSSKGTDYLNITWKFYDHVISHLEIKEGAKDASSLISKKLILQ